MVWTLVKAWPFWQIFMPLLRIFRWLVRQYIQMGHGWIVQNVFTHSIIGEKGRGYNKLIHGCNTKEYTLQINQSIKYQWICTIQSISHQIITNSRQMFASSMIFWRITNLIQIFSTLWWMWYLYWIHSAYLKYDSCTPACWSRPILRPFTTSITGLSTRIVLKFHSWEVTMIHQWICCFLTEKDESVGRNLKTIYLWTQH